jgi:hypothetical protein
MQDHKVSRTSKCRRVWNWIIMLLLWGSIVFFSLSLSSGIEPYAAIATFVATYIGYIITCFCSPTFSYLKHKHKAQSIHTYMHKLFSTAPEISFHVECYHYVTTYHTSYSNGRSRRTTRRSKVVTHRETQPFTYYSWRDISGLFILDSHKIIRSHKKAYIKLELEKNIELNDDITRYDYQRQKDDIYNRNRGRDTHMSFWETREISDYSQYNLIKISDVNPRFVNVWCYVLFIILPFIEFYKIYVNQYCVDQDYTIKKLVSTRYNLNLPEHSSMYENLKPALSIFDQPRQEFSNSAQVLHDTPQLPSLDELEEAKKFTNQNGLYRHIPGTVLTESYQPHFMPSNTSNLFNENNNNITGFNYDSNANLNVNNQNIPYNATNPIPDTSYTSIDLSNGPNNQNLIGNNPNLNSMGMNYSRNQNFNEKLI